MIAITLRFAAIISVVTLAAGAGIDTKKDDKVPAGCFLQLRKDGTYKCCRVRGAQRCTKLPSKLGTP